MEYLIDTHCHLDSFLQNNTLEDCLKEASSKAVNKMIAVGTDASDWALYQSLAEKYPNTIYYTVGLHPCHVTEEALADISKLHAFFKNTTKPKALGECGLDYFRLPKDPSAANAQKKLQQKAFEEQLAIAKELDCPVVIHSRHALDECIACIDSSGVDWTKVVFHCFSEGPESIEKINTRGGRGSFTGVITYKSADDVRAAAKAQGLDTLMLETDSPYLAPTPHRGKPNQPAYTHHIAEYCKDLFGADLDTIRSQTTQNATHFFGL